LKRIPTIRTLTIVQRGLTSFAVCGRCNGRFESKFLNRFKAKHDIQEKYEAHKCREVEDFPGIGMETEMRMDSARAQALRSSNGVVFHFMTNSITTCVAACGVWHGTRAVLNVLSGTNFRLGQIMEDRRAFARHRAGGTPALL
jgi:hypothetical protein